MLLVRDIQPELTRLLARFDLNLRVVGPDDPIPGSYWGAPEAGLVADELYARPETPLHSALHEACHYICMDATRRHTLHTDALGDDLEECAVCYLQIVLAAELPAVGAEALCRDMDAWGYSFRLGSTRSWFERDADDARSWLVRHHVLHPSDRPTWRKRQ